MDLKIERLNMDHEDKVVKLVTSTYTKSEVFRSGTTMNVSSDLFTELDTARAKAKLKQGLSFGIFHEKNGLVAVTLNVIRLKSNNSSYQETSGVYKDTHWTNCTVRIVEQLRSIMETKLDPQKAFLLSMTSVHPDFRRIGLSKQLTHKCEGLAIEEDCVYIISMVSSGYRLQGLLKLGYSIAGQIDLRTYYDDVAGTTPFSACVAPDYYFTLCYKAL